MLPFKIILYLEYKIEVYLMDKNINALLNNNLRVIVPEFGAFIIRQKKPRIVVFNEFLRYNDGLLIEDVAKTHSVDLEIARQLVTDYTDNIAKVLESGQSYTIKGIGLLQKDTDGKIIFKSESKSLTDTKSDMIPEPPASPDQEVKPAAKVKPKRTVKDSAAARDMITEPVTEQEATKETAAPTPVEIILEEVQPLDTDTVSPVKEEVEKRDMPDMKTPGPDHISQMPDEKREVKVQPSPGMRPNQVVRWIIIIVLANAAIIIWFIAGDHIRELFKGKKRQVVVVDSLYQNLSDSIKVAAADTTLIFGEEEIISQKEENAAADEILRYYIVVGSFRNESNADSLVNTLKGKGYNAEKFVMIGNKYIVSGASFDDKELAVKELKRIREEIAPDAWMTRF